VARWFDARNQHFFSGSLYLCRQAGIPVFLKEWQPEAIIVEANPRYLSTPGAVRWMHQRGWPVIGWGLGAPAAQGPLAGLRRAARFNFLKQFDALVAYSRRGAEEYCQAGFPAGRVFVAPNAVAPCPQQPAPERPAEFRGGVAVVLFVGRLQARKRIDLLLQACAALPPEIRPRLWVVGDGPSRVELEALAQKILPSTLFYGARRGAELDALFAAADLFVLPGTGGLAVQQAMSFGLPVIVAEGDGTQSDLVRPENGWMVAPGQLEALVCSLTEALSNPARLRQMGRASDRIVREEVNLEHMVDVFTGVVNTVMTA
jgi:glycosyltransferase involved in cell wall biosynthesis